MHRGELDHRALFREVAAVAGEIEAGGEWSEAVERVVRMLGDFVLLFLQGEAQDAGQCGIVLHVDSDSASVLFGDARPIEVAGKLRELMTGPHSLDRTEVYVFRLRLHPLGYVRRRCFNEALELLLKAGKFDRADMFGQLVHELVGKESNRMSDSFVAIGRLKAPPNIFDAGFAGIGHQTACQLLPIYPAQHFLCRCGDRDAC